MTLNITLSLDINEDDPELIQRMQDLQDKHFINPTRTRLAIKIVKDEIRSWLESVSYADMALVTNIQMEEDS